MYVWMRVSPRASVYVYYGMKGVMGGQPGIQMSWGQASSLLNMSRQALEDTREGLQPGDMLSLVQLLAWAADVPTDTAVEGNGSLATTSAGELSHTFITVADSIISQDNAPKWQAIKQVPINYSNVFIKPFSHQVPERQAKTWSGIRWR